MALHLPLQAVANAATPADALDWLRMAQIGAIAVVDPTGLDDPIARRIRREALAVWAHGAVADLGSVRGLNLAAGDEDVRRKSVATARVALTRAADMGARLWSTWPGEALAETHAAGVPSPGVPRPRALDQLKRSLDTLATEAEGLGISLLLINPDGSRPSMLGTDGSELVQVFEALQVPFLGGCLDVGQLWAGALARRFEAAEVEARLRPHVRALRLSELDPRGRAGRLPEPEGRLAEWLSLHPEWHALPMALAVRPTPLARMLETAEALESRLVAPLQGPVPRA